VRKTEEGLIAGRYRLGEVLGRGGVGEVHRATDEVLGRQVAVKVMQPIPRTLAIPERFLREARAAAMIRSPQVVAAYDFGAYGDGYYLAMELVSGRSLADELKVNGLFSPERAEQVVRQGAAGLAAAHEQRIVHRDIKASNLLLAHDGTVKIADFGIVRFLHDPTTTLTSTGQIIGTSYYLSPECARGQPAGPPSDVYALGCVLYQIVTGRPPFVADAPAAIMYQHVQDAPRPPSELRPDLPADLEALILWMLDKVPENRPTAGQIADGIAAAIAAKTDPEATALAPTPRTTSRPMFAGIAAAVALAVSATVGILLETRGVELPATNDLSPGQGAATTPVVPRTPAIQTSEPRKSEQSPPARRTPSPSARRPSSTVLSQDNSGHGNAKPGPKDDRSHRGKPKKPKP